MSLGERIRAARVAKRMTLRALSRSIGVSAPFMSDVEHNRRTLTDTRIDQIATVLGIDPSTLHAVNGLSRGLKDWIRNNPELIEYLNTLRDRNQSIVIGGPTCPCCNRRIHEHD